MNRFESIRDPFFGDIGEPDSRRAEQEYCRKHVSAQVFRRSPYRLAFYFSGRVSDRLIGNFFRYFILSSASAHFLPLYLGNISVQRRKVKCFFQRFQNDGMKTTRSV